MKYNISLQRTVRLQLQPNHQEALALCQTMERNTWSFNAVCRYGWEQNLTNGTELHKTTYYEHRRETGLPSQLVCAARVKAAEALKSAKALKKKAKIVNRPESKHCPIRYDARSYSIWFDRQELTILAMRGRIKLSFEVAQYYRQYLRLVFEDLTNIRGRAKMRKAQRRRLHGWSFAQFQAFVAYKAEAKSVKVGFVDPRYTSQKCSQCGHIERGNRPTQAEFRCKKCRFECHADYNVSMNIRDDFLRLRASVNTPIVPADNLG